MKDRLSPHSLNAEQGALACALLDGNLAHELKPDWFYDPRHQNLAAELRQMASAGNPIDVATLVEFTRQTGATQKCGGVPYIAAMPDFAPSAHNFGYWRSTLEEMAHLRAVLAVCGDFSSRAYECTGPDSSALLDEFERAALAIRETGGTDAEPNLREQMRDVIGELEAAVQHQGQLRGLPTGFADLDKMTNGLREGQLVIIAARPSIGKTSLAMNVAERVAVDARQPVGVFSLEMSARELLFRMTCSRARVSSQAATAGNLSQRDIEKLTAVSAAISKSPLHIVDVGGLTIGRLAGIARRLVQRHGIKLVIVDYLQLLRGAEKRLENRVAEITAISNGLKLLARELRLPIIACAQLNRASETEQRKPRLSDLRDSGSIEQDADLVGLLHRGESDGGDAQGVELILAKQRNGPTGTIKLTFFQSITRFEQAA